MGVPVGSVGKAPESAKNVKSEAEKALFERTSSSAVADRPRHASCPLKFCYLLSHSSSLKVIPNYTIE